MCKVLIIEPHGDDALCSCSSILRNNNLDIDVLTLADSRSSSDLVNHYPSVKNVKYLQCEDIDYRLRPKVSTHEIHKLFLEGKDVYAKYLDDTLYGLGKSDFTEYSSWSTIGDMLFKMFSLQSYGYILVPVGLVHPFHLATREIVDFCTKVNCISSRCIYYADKPYLGNRYAKECMESFAKSLKMHKLEAQYAGRGTKVKTILSKVYPTETTMLRFSSKALLEDPDIFLSTDNPDNFKEVLFDETVVCNAI